MTTTVDATVIGEALVDIVQTATDTTELPGGSPANVALALGRRGRAVSLVTSLGDDARGSAVRAWLAASRVGIEAAPLERTSTALARIGADGAADYEFDIDWRLAGATAPRALVVHHGSIASLLDPGAADVARLIGDARAQSLITYDPNIRAVLLDDAEVARSRVAEHVRAADLVKASDEDIAWLYPGADPQEVAQAWLDDGPGLVVVTAGAQGAFAAYSGGIVHVPAPRVSVADTVGAGDTVMSALVDALVAAAGSDDVDSRRRALASWSDETIERALRSALAAAAITVSRPGADPPWSHELEG